MQIDIEDLHRIQVKPGDRFVYCPRGLITEASAAEIQAHWRQVFPDNDLLILPAGTLTTAGPAPDNSPDAVIERYRQHSDGIAPINQRGGGA